MTQVFDFTDYGALLGLVTNSLIAGALLGVIGGLVGFFVMARDLPFAVHGISELSFAGAAAALLVGADVVTGSVVGSLLAALLIGVLGARARERNSVIGVLMPFGLGLGILFLALYSGRSANRFGLLTGASKHTVTPLNTAADEATVLQTARNSAVLLQNTGSTLPLSSHGSAFSPNIFFMYEVIGVVDAERFASAAN